MSKIQSVIFDKSSWTLSNANKWLRRHGFKEKFRGKGVDETPNTYRFRQSDPKDLRTITKKATKGISFIIQFKK